MNKPALLAKRRPFSLQMIKISAYGDLTFFCSFTPLNILREFQPKSRLDMPCALYKYCRGKIDVRTDVLRMNFCYMSPNLCGNERNHSMLTPQSDYTNNNIFKFDILLGKQGYNFFPVLHTTNINNLMNVFSIEKQQP